MKPLQRHLWRTVKINCGRHEEFNVPRRGTRRYHEIGYRDSYLLGRYVSIDSYRRFEEISDSVFRINQSKIWTANPEGECSTNLRDAS